MQLCNQLSSESAKISLEGYQYHQALEMDAHLFVKWQILSKILDPQSKRIQKEALYASSLFM